MFKDICKRLNDIARRSRPEYSIETHDAERIMQSESIHVRAGCAKPRKKNVRVRPPGNIALSRRRRARGRVNESPVGGFTPPAQIDSFWDLSSFASPVDSVKI